jgi:aspartate aminotransferase
MKFIQNLSFENNYKSISNFCPEKTIISTGLSKWCGAGGWRLGYFIVPDS